MSEIAPLKLYHYRPLKTLEHLTHLQNFAKQQVYFQPFKEFNDPFEGKFIYTPHPPEEILQDSKLFEEYFSAARCKNPHLTEHEFKENLKLIINPEKPPEKPNDLTSPAANLFENHGCICFTKDCSNIPMWAHYGNNHQGYCIEFELDLNQIKSSGFDDDYIDGLQKGSEILSFEREGFYFWFSKVRYVESQDLPEISFKKICEKRKEFGFDSYEVNKYIMQHSIGVKFEKWQCEEEFRLAANTSSQTSKLCDLRRYASFLKVTGIILGDKIGRAIDTDLENFIRTQCLLDNSHYDPAITLKAFIRDHLTEWAPVTHKISLYQAKLSGTEYKINTEQLL